ncbi:MAG: site-2 protease family protein [Chloroflexi bacterium]|nr:site-2 protease family protein [Chloroflexota bacterium]
MTIIVAIVVLSLLMFVHELGHLIVAKWTGVHVEEFGLGYPPRLMTIARAGDTIYTLNLIPFGAFVRLAEEGEPGTLFSDKSTPLRAAFLLSGPTLNLLLSIVLFSICFATGWPVAHDLAVGVQKVLPGSVAQAIGFEDNDLILAVDDYEVSTVLDLIVYARSVNGDIRKVTLRRQGRRLTLSLPPGGPWFVKPESRGVAVRNDAGWVEIVSHPWPEAVQKAVTETLLSVSSLFLLLIKILRGLIPVDLVRPVGPVGIAQLTKQAAQQVVTSGWWFPLLQLTATLSAALAATNLLPLPGLDGGRLLFVAIEALRGKRIDPDRESLIHFVGIILMLMLILIVTYYDITTPYAFGGR